MSLFQESVLNKYLSELDNEHVSKSWQLFRFHFHDLVKQANILQAKEEQYQEGFLSELFGGVLGYSLYPQPNFNIKTEHKNEKDSKKADGAIFKNDKVRAVIELKSTSTIDLGKIENQAFSYKNNQQGCDYVITSNFRKLRLYVQDATDFDEFDLFTLSFQDFQRLYLYLHKDKLLNDIPLKLKQSSVNKEQEVTKALYKDYSHFKSSLFTNLLEFNTNYDKLELFKKTQKLLDRFLFILFAEDRGLLPPNAVGDIIKDWKQLKELDNYVPLYDRFKKYFGYLNNGYIHTDYEIFAYNGGLFAEDEVLDNLLISDEVLHTGMDLLSRYNFISEVDVNILGHIFEHSLNEIEEIQLQLEGKILDKSKTKRKKDGVFYTPKYITKYIVQNTVGILCKEQKEALGINEEEYAPIHRKPNKKALNDKLDTYRTWLLQLTILDPACGSGAFLNQALDFLIQEHRKIDELRANLFGDAMVLTDLDNEILENNIFGVDINEEAVEIARLSLWLKTAKKGRKLTNLSNNIKCGNSLIDNTEIAGNKSFRWEEEFKEIFAKGRFDVVIGNPPYATKIFSKDEMNWYKTNYNSASYQLDLYILFLEKIVSITKENGLIGLITPNSWLKNLTMSKIRKYLLENVNFYTILPNIPNVFEDASVDSLIFIASKLNAVTATSIYEFNNFQPHLKHLVSQQEWLNNANYVFTVEASSITSNLLKKMNSSSNKLSDFFEISRGINPYDSYRGQSKEIIETKAYHASFKKDETFVPELRGKHIGRYSYTWDGQHYISYGPWLAAPRENKYFTGERFVFRQVLDKYLVCTVIEEDFKIDQSVFIAVPKKKEVLSTKYVLALIASKLGAFYFKHSSNEFDELFPKIKLDEFKNLPIKAISREEQQPFTSKTEIMLTKSRELSQITEHFKEILKTNFEGLVLSKKFNNLNTLTFKDLIKELEKSKHKLALEQQNDWLEFFQKQKTKVDEIVTLINKTDNEIDKMVYNLYDLTKDEINLVDSSFNG